MLWFAAVPIVFTLLAGGVALLAARGKWIVYRLVLGVVSLFLAMLAGMGWLEFGLSLGRPLEQTGDEQLYIGWNPRAMLQNLPWLLGILLFLGLIVAARRFRARANRPDKT
jgi:hypothetical protein